MAHHRFSASRRIAAPASAVYGIVADYRHGHQLILPRPPFIAMTVEQGGIGAGTVVAVQMKLMGLLQSFRASVEEPEPGRVLRETIETTGVVTTFTIDPSGPGECVATIATETVVYEGVMGRVQGWLTVRLLRPVYLKELALLEARARSAP